jgi:hypothetical protein
MTQGMTRLLMDASVVIEKKSRNCSAVLCGAPIIYLSTWPKSRLVRVIVHLAPRDRADA